MTVLPTAAAAAAPVAPSAPWTWGANSFGQLGNGTTTARPTPGAVPGLNDVVDLHGGREHVIALRSNGTVWVWGSNGEGQLGLGTTTNRSVADAGAGARRTSWPWRPATTCRWP